MKIKNQISLVTITLLLLSLAITVSVAVVAVRNKGNADIAQYKTDELQKKREKISTLVDIAYGIIDTNYNNVKDREFLEKYYGYRLKNVIDIVESILTEKAGKVEKEGLSLAEAQKQACDEIRTIRYDRGTGYVWINDTARPYPTMIMHPTISSLEGKLLDDPQFNCALGKKENLFRAFVDVCEQNGGGFVDYLWPKPTEEGLIPDTPKLSYVRLFEQWNWIVGTGIYIDDALVDAIEKCKSDIRIMRYDGGTGYLWINDTGRPYPVMLMHPTMPSLEGKVMDAPEYNCTLGEKKNLFQVFQEVCDERGEGFVEYMWPKPTRGGLGQPAPKLSYVKLYEPLGWIIGTGIYIDDIDAEINLKIASMDKQVNKLILTIVLISLVIILAGVGLSFASAGTLTRPIEKLIRSMKEIQEEGLSFRKVDLRGVEEIRKLGDIFNRMLDAIIDSIRRLAETTASKERIESELRIARDIQMGILPRLFPAFPERSEFDVYAIIDPAREVGGDLYDFFFIDEDSFCFLVGDVSGKGVPAAFFMAVTKTLIKAVAETGRSAGEIVTKVNEDLSAENESCMFVTLFYAVLNVKTGEVHYTNAGHNPPLLLAQKEKAVFLRGRGHPQLMAGALDGVTYRTDSLVLSPGDSIFLYTDGVTEAMNNSNELYSDDRLLQALSNFDGKSPEDLINDVMKNITEFTGGAEQSDDITILTLKFKGPEAS
ncbi:MAG: cache domain-containing protein [bacterium]